MNTADHRHQQLDDEFRDAAHVRGQQVDADGDIHVDAEPVASGRAEEGQHDGEQHRRRLRPRGGAVEHVAGEDRPRDHRGNQHQRRRRR